MIRSRFFVMLFLFLSVSQNTMAQQLSSEATISILTCNPGKDIYSIYGHSAIRISDPVNGIDAVYNYGVFSFDSPNFIYRFAKGQTDYLMVGEHFSSFLPVYEEEKRTVYEQVLNLTTEGKNILFKALIENSMPENRKYRYNFFMDNCATRIRDMIERNVGSPVRFPENIPASKSYRQLIKEYHQSIRWADLGIDLLVGKKAENPFSARGHMFLPDYLKTQFDNALINIDGKEKPLVSEARTLLEYPNSKLRSSFPLPFLVFLLLAVLVAAISIWGYIKKKYLLGGLFTYDYHWSGRIYYWLVYLVFRTSGYEP